MEPIPLIPVINSVSCPDTSHILREEFQDFLGKKKFPEKIAENLQEYNSNELQLKTCGMEVVHSYKDMRTETQELTYAEKLVLIAQAEYLTKKSKKQPTEPGTTFKLNQIYPDIDPITVKKYSLIQTQDILPHITERIINCKMEPQEFIFKNACSQSKRNVNKLTKLECLGTCKKGQKCNLKITASQESRRAKIHNYNKRRRELKKQIKHDYSKKQVFVAEPNQIIFNNFEKNIVYEQTLRLRNITTSPQSFKPPLLSEHSKFSVKQHTDEFKLAPGMCALFTVSFLVHDLTDSHSDVLVFNVPGSQSIYVNLQSHRNVPVVKGLIYYDDDVLYEEIKSGRDKDEVYNYTIDCGAVMYGCSKELKLIVQNGGGHGVFFLLGEEDWVSGEVNNVTETFTLTLQDFSITPAYFELKEREIKEITINFSPTQYGLCLDKVFFLCDSNTVEEIDIIGDCLFYEPHFIKFEMPDCPFYPYKRSREPKNVLHLGAVYLTQTKTGSFTVFNTSMVSFSYEWRRNKYRRSNGFIPIDNDCIEIRPSEGIFAAASETEFQVSVTMNSAKIGLYKFAFSLYVLDIMEKNLSECTDFTFGEEYSNESCEKYLTVLVDKMEVQIHHILLQVNVYPEEITFPTLLYNVESCAKTVRVVNNGFCCMFCEWIHCKDCGCQSGGECEIRVEPRIFDLESNSSVDCSFWVLPTSYDNISEHFVLSINRGYSAQSLSLHALVEKPHISVSPSFFDLGSKIKRDSEVKAVFYVQNSSTATLYWRVHEYRYVFETNRFHEVCSCGLDSDCGILCHEGSGTKLEYNLDTSTSRRFLTLLVFYTIYKDELYESSHVILLANIMQPEIRILSENYKENIFSIQEKFFVNETITRSFFIHNDSSIEVGYSWGEPAGIHSSMVSVSFDTWSGRLYPFSRRCVHATLQFLVPGALHDVFVQLGVEALPDPDPPLCLHICCTVKPPQVLFSIPSDPTCKTLKYVDVTWPSYEIEHSEIFTAVEDAEESQVKEFTLAPEIEEKTIINLMDSNVETNENSQVLSYFPDDIVSHLQNIQMPDSEEEYHYPSTTIIEEVNTAEFASEKTTCAQLASVFGTNTSISENLFEFRNVQCRQLYKKTVDITNIMDLPIKYSIIVKNFKRKIFYRKKLDNILINLNWKPDDKYSQQLSEYGIVVIIEPTSGEIKNKSTVTIEFQVYAETWGFYLEEVGIEVDDLPIFYINIFIQVTGLPIEFPVQANSLELSENIVRFGGRSVCSSVETRTICFRNICTIPVTVVWHMFVKNIEDHLRGSINIAYDIFGFEANDDSVDCKVRVTPYFGKESSEKFNLFQIQPNEIYIKPKELKSVNVSLNPKYFSSNTKSYNINGILIGHIYIENKFQKINNESNFVMRHPEKELDPIKIHVTAEIDPGELDLNCIRGERSLNVAVSDFLQDDCGVLVNLRLVFRNTASCTVAIGVNIDEPFGIVAVTSAANHCTLPDKNGMYTADVHADCCVEVLVKCVVDANMLMSIADLLYSSIPYYVEDLVCNEYKQVKITKKLHIYQKCNIKQELPLSVSLTFPLTVVSVENLDFGPVRFGTEKTMTIKLLNKTNSPTWFRTEIEVAQVFRVKPSSGYLYPALPHDHSVYLTVTFKPRDIAVYEDVLAVITCFSQYRQEIKLTGLGTYDEKYMYDLPTI